MIRMLPLAAMVMLAFIPDLVSAQVDRARGDIYEDFTRSYNETVQNAKNENRDAAIRSLLENAQKLTGMLQVTGDAPGKLNDGNLRDLANDAQKFLESMGKYRDKSVALMERLKRGGEDYRSELSSFEDSNRELKERFNTLWAALQREGEKLQREGEDLAKKTKGLKAVCERGCGL